MICVPLAEPNAMTAREAMLRAATRADLVEIRIDQFQNLPTAQELASIFRDRPCPIIATCRPKSLGGLNDWPDDVRLKVLQACVELGAEYVDIELEHAGKITRRGKTRLIVSYHNFTSTPLDVASIYTQIVQAGADVVKIATTANSIIDNLRVLEIVRRAALPCIGLCMGEAGLISRVLGRKFGSVLTYAPMEKTKATAAGQILLDELIGLYNYRAITSETKVYGVIGNPIAHSISPHIHNAAFRALGINAVYLPFKVEGDLRNFIDAFRGIPVKGYSITIPHKEAALAALDEVDQICRSIGAVNTVLNNKGRLIGSNTDWSAAVEAIEKGLGGEPLIGKRVALIGAGGTARATVFGLKSKRARVCIYNRTEERARKLAADMGCEWRSYNELDSLEADVIVNTTSLGMYPKTELTPVPAHVLKPGMVVFDTVYNPVWTRLLTDAAEAGCVTVSGIEMFVNQAVQQFKTWTGLAAPRELMEAVAHEKLAAME